MNDSVIIIAPHPDDEVLGCGGVIARFIDEGRKVYVAIVTKGCKPLYTKEQVKSGRQEVKKAHKILGITATYFLDFPAAELDQVMHRKINQSLSELFRKIQPQSVFIPFFGDLHCDHRLSFVSALVASRPVSVFSPRQIYVYETLSETNWNAPYITPTFVPNVFIDIEKYLDKKLNAFRCFKSQCKKFPHERSVECLEYLAKLRGAQVNRKAAEAFILVREIL